jgi:predicted ATP-grasp superfamily ATP-dependent carboligase
MSYLTIFQPPEVKTEHLIIAFGGWADAGESATTAIKFLQRNLGARKLAEIDPEEFYDFSHTRPYTSRTRDGRRRIHWPANKFSYWAESDRNKAAITFLGVEPSLRWRTYSRTIVDLAQEHGVKKVLHIGALLDAVPHTREVKFTGVSTDADLQAKLDASGVRSSNYQGPTGISAAVLEACGNQGLDCLSLWGHTPHYLQAAPNYRVGYSLARKLVALLDLSLDLSELQTAADTFDQQVVTAVANDDQLSAYVGKLEGQYDELAIDAEISDPAELVHELEQFLWAEQRRRPGDHQS